MTRRQWELFWWGFLCGFGSVTFLMVGAVCESGGAR